MTVASIATDKFFETRDELVISGLRVKFEVVKNSAKDPNTCSLEIYGCSERTRAQLQHKPLAVFLDAGYDGQTHRLFNGDLRYANSRIEGTDWVTKLEIADGARSLSRARVNRSYSSGTSLKTVVSDVVKQMGLRIPTNMNGARELDAQFATGVVIEGLASSELSRLLKPHKISWSIQNSRLQMLRENEVRSDAVLLFTPDTGLIGTPEYGTPTKEQKSPSLSLQVMLEPDVLPGGKIKIESKSVNGLFKVERCTHDGDLYGPEWITSIEAKSV